MKLVNGFKFLGKSPEEQVGVVPKNFQEGAIGVRQKPNPLHQTWRRPRGSCDPFPSIHR